jgi:predicted AlkP superfamily pyrophosphatase or phosphodiesterase
MIVGVTFLGLLFVIRAFKHHSNGPRRVILVSIDGFRFEYLRRGETPTLSKLGTNRS